MMVVTSRTGRPLVRSSSYTEVIRYFSTGTTVRHLNWLITWLFSGSVMKSISLQMAKKQLMPSFRLWLALKTIRNVPISD